MKAKIIRSLDYSLYRQIKRGELLRKFYDMFRTNFNVESEDFTSQQINYMMQELYYKGSVLVIKNDVTEKPVVVPYAVSSYNNEEYPVNVEPINHRGIKGLFDRRRKYVNMVNAVVGYIRPSRYNNIMQIVEDSVDDIVDVIVTIKINLLAQKMPFILTCASEDEMSLKRLMKDIMDDNAQLVTRRVGVKDIQVLSTGASYNIDKLEQHKQTLINDLLTQLGINNNNQEKKAQVNEDEINSNNDEIDKSGDVYINMLNEFSEDIKEVLGFNITFKWNGGSELKEDNKDAKSDDEESL